MEEKITEEKITIERRLELYAKEHDSSGRKEKLWYAWRHNKNWLSEILMWAMLSFPSYSLHDRTHAESILNNIEMLLGSQVVNKLSATDCFIILHTVYIHDIGMCITFDEREKILESPEFIDFIESWRSNDILNYYAEILREKVENIDDTLTCADSDRMRWYLDVYSAILYLVAEYRRADHARQSSNMLKDMIDDPDKLGAGFATSGLPIRFYHMIAKCASVHTSNDFKDILDLPHENNGYATDYFHPRFVAVLLQLGDALDLDNDRFHPLMQQFAGILPQMSRIHFGKHQAIRQLLITPSEIHIFADCKTMDEAKIVRQEMKAIEDILENATFKWAMICPPTIVTFLPVVTEKQILLKGKVVPDFLIDARFNIQEKNAFNFLQGSNIYKKPKLVFLREIFQNAIDATKLQYWYDLTGREREIDADKCWEVIPTRIYPIYINFWLASKEKYESEIRKWEFYNEFASTAEQWKRGCEYGVLVQIEDYGVGISERDVEKIADVGTTAYSNRKILEKAPGWLQPTAEFGIGLQSIFLVAQSFVAITKVRNDACYYISFEASGNKGKGNISVMQLEEGDKDYRQEYGTSMEIFIPSNQMQNDLDDEPIGKSADPFQIDDDIYSFAEERIYMERLCDYLDGIVCEKIFPVTVRYHDIETLADGRHKFYEPKNFKCEIIREGQKLLREGGDKNAKMNEAEQEDEFRKDPSWFFSGDNTTLQQDGKDIYYKYDSVYDKLYICVDEVAVFACFSAQRIMTQRKQVHGDDDISEDDLNTKIYYKGVLVNNYNFDKDLNMLEYIDIKGTLNQSYIAINRSDFTEAGITYIKETIYEDLLKCVSSVVRGIYTDDAYRGIFGINGKKNKKAHHHILTICGLYLLMQSQYMGKFRMALAQDHQVCGENKLQELSEEIGEIKENNEEWSKSTLYHLRVIKKEQRGSLCDSEVDIAEFISNLSNYAILSKRSKHGEAWVEYIIDIRSIQKEENKGKEIKKLISQLKDETDWDERGKNEKKLSEHSKSIMDIDLEKHDVVPRDNQNFNQAMQNMVVNWLLKSIASSAVFFDKKHNIRVNILDTEYTDSIYLNNEVKCAICDRIKELYESDAAQRFYTVANTSFCQLSVDQVNAHMLFVKRGRFSGVGRRNVIFPLSGESVYNLIYDLESIHEAVLNFERSNSTKFIIKRVLLPEVKELVDKSYKENLSKNSSEIKTKMEELKGIMEKWLIKNYAYVEGDSSKTKNALIDYVYHHNLWKWSKKEIERLYDLYISDIFRCLWGKIVEGDE